jgi:hypothetical protein
MESLIVPSSIQRIRSFLVEMCGMKVKPWASTEETLAALHTTLVARHGCDIFWTSLRVLLETLAHDLKTRQEAVPGTLVDNEVLDSKRYATLLDEIRASLAQQTADPPTATFRRLASSLSTPALALLLLLGGAASVGCDQTTLHLTPDAATQDLADARDTAKQDLADAIKSQPDTRVDTSSFILLPDTRAPFDTRDTLNAATSGPDGATVTIQDIMQSCNISSEDQGMVLGCLSQMRDSWIAGLTSMLAGEDCADVTSQLNCSATSYYESCAYQSSNTDFNLASLPLCRPILIYAGVCFV